MLQKNTRIKTPTGSTSISELKVGDFVCNEFGSPVQVKKLIHKGKFPIVDIMIASQKWASCSIDHCWLVKEGCGLKQNIIELQSISKFKPSNRIVVKIDDRIFNYGLSVQIEKVLEEDDVIEIDVDSATRLVLLENGLITQV